MFSGRNCLFLGAASLGFVVVSGGCGSDTSSGALHSFNGNSNVPGAGTTGNSAGAPTVTAGSAGMAATAGGATGGSGAPPASAGATATAGAPAGGAPATGGSTAMGGTTATAGATAMGGTTATAGAGGGSTGTCPAPTGTHQATALDRSCWTATASDCAMSSANMNPPVGAIDASTTTRWSTGLTMVAETAPFTYQVDMTTAVMIAGVTIGTNNSATDYALMLKVEVSTDGTTWNPVACGAGTATTDFSFAPVSARYVRLTQSGSAATGGGSGWWSIYDFNVYGSTGTEKACATTGPGAAGPTCTTPHTT